jgi:uncharacterized protein HemX
MKGTRFMKLASQKDKSAGFALVETVLIVVILAAIVGVGVYIMRQKQNTNSTLSSTSNGTLQAKSLTGTTANISQLTQQDAQTEASVDSSADSQTQQDATSANGAVNNVGGAYNETNL